MTAGPGEPQRMTEVEAAVASVVDAARQRPGHLVTGFGDADRRAHARLAEKLRREAATHAALSEAGGTTGGRV